MKAMSTLSTKVDAGNLAKGGKIGAQGDEPEEAKPSKKAQQKAARAAARAEAEAAAAQQ